MRSLADGHAAGGIRRHDGAHQQPVARLRGGRADAALEVERGGAEPRADTAEREFGTRDFRRLIAELAIRRIAAPGLVAAREQIEQDRARHDGNARLAHLEAAAPLAQPRLHAGSGIEPEGRAARQRDGVDAFHGLRRIEQSGLARARTAAAHVHARHHGGVEHDRGDAGAELGVAGMAHPQAGNIGDEIA